MELIIPGFGENPVTQKPQWLKNEVQRRLHVERENLG
jgi:hypothetical protein